MMVRRTPPRRLIASLFAILVLFAPVCSAADIVEINRLFRVGEYAECIDAAGKAIEEGPFNENYRLLKIRAEMELGRYADALKTLDAALPKMPQSIQLRWIGRDVCRFNRQAERAKKLEEEIGETLQQFPWRFGDAANQLVVGRFLLDRGVDPKRILEAVYSEVQRRQPNYVEVHLARGELALAKYDYQLAGDAFQQAAKLDPTSADVHFGIAQAFAPSDPDKTDAALRTAMEQNPHHVASMLLIVDSRIDAERYDEAEEVLARIAAVNPQHPQAFAYRAVLAHLRNQPEQEKQHREAALKHYPENPEVDHLIGQKLSQKYRFAEGEQYQRRSLALAADYAPSITQLAQDLLRLGREEEGMQLAEAAYKADGYNVVVHNLVTLQEHLSKFRTLEEDGFVVRMEAREAEIYGSRVLSLLKKAKRELCAKYDVKLEAPIIVEIFPRQQDFAIRTFGLPGGAGFLGVCFGTVITANSPAALGGHATCWEATLWHEFCHVVTLNKTHNKMPRWLSEGISVYEERLADPAWGQAMNPRYREMLLGDDFTPVSRLSAAFLKPKSPLHLQFAYYESSLVVEYLVEKHGLDTLRRVLVDLGVGMPINESLARYAGSSETLDAEFKKYAEAKANALAPEMDWSKPELPPRATPDDVAAYLKSHPKNYAALQLWSTQLLAGEKWEEAKTPLETLRTLYPNNFGAGNPYASLATVHRKLDDAKGEREMLVKLVESSADDVASFSRLAELASQAGDWTTVKRASQRLLAVNPLVAESQRRAAEAASHLNDHALAAESYRAMLSLDPLDPAELNFRLASEYKQSGDLAKAKRHVLLALEETPRYRDAQRLLLELVAEQPMLEVGTSGSTPGEKQLKDGSKLEKGR